MDRATAKLIYVISVFVLFIAVLILSICQLKGWMMAVIGAWVVLGCVLMRYLRCPRCGKLPGRDMLSAQYCSRCGEPLD